MWRFWVREEASKAYLQAHLTEPTRYPEAQAQAMKLQWLAVEKNDPELAKAQKLKRGAAEAEGGDGADKDLR